MQKTFTKLINSTTFINNLRILEFVAAYVTAVQNQHIQISKYYQFIVLIILGKYFIILAQIQQ